MGSICLKSLVLVRDSKPGALPCQTAASNVLGVTSRQGEQRIEAAVKFLLPCPAGAESGDRSSDGGHAGQHNWPASFRPGQSWIWALKTEAGQPLRLARGFVVTWESGQSQLITSPSACTLQNLLHRPASARGSNSPDCWGGRWSLEFGSAGYWFPLTRLCTIIKCVGPPQEAIAPFLIRN